MYICFVYKMYVLVYGNVSFVLGNYLLHFMCQFTVCQFTVCPLICMYCK